MRWGAFFGTTLIITILIFMQWPKIKKYSKKEKLVFFILLFIGWGLSLFDLPHIAGPTTWMKVIFKPFAPLIES
ncbi:hypothetical protein [Niallia endozanthoxylica]|uniref:Uncharacterized protein n=1 Tax=Niallia endozanthoxylica TaxID=2036016 RepID=A0A5J5I707_9BACI|nr:hypothetical protein [Niallia endozanthoxylica]KAA9031582.1 hypothetical protein F4V44_00610 [Niallia endozanthoxylica]